MSPTQNVKVPPRGFVISRGIFPKKSPLNLTSRDFLNLREIFRIILTEHTTPNKLSFHITEVILSSLRNRFLVNSFAPLEAAFLDLVRSGGAARCSSATILEGFG
jgi:hypothetical protein